MKPTIINRIKNTLTTISAFKQIPFICALCILSLYQHPALGALTEPIAIENHNYYLRLNENTNLVATENGRHINNRAIHYEGVVIDFEESSWVRVSDINGNWEGALSFNNRLYIISSSPDAQSTRNLIAQAVDEPANPVQCGTLHNPGPLQANPHAGNKQPGMFTPLGLNNNSANNALFTVKLVLVFDAYFSEIYPDNYEDKGNALLNIVQGYYNAAQIEFNIVDIRYLKELVFNRGTASTENDPYTLMEDIRSKMELGDISFIEDRSALFHLVSGKAFDGNIVGLGYDNGIGKTDGTNTAISQLHKGIAGTALVAAHELGHNLNAIHDDEPLHCGSSSALRSIMCATINTGQLNEFKAASISLMHSALHALPYPPACCDYREPLVKNITEDDQPVVVDNGGGGGGGINVYSLLCLLALCTLRRIKIKSGTQQ